MSPRTVASVPFAQVSEAGSGWARLADNDGYGFFASLDDLVVTGPTHTNVNDFRAIVVT